ncbi:MAG: MliC family protein, partial [Bacilli bacterium]
GVFALAFYLGEQYGEAKAVLNQSSATSNNNVINDVTYICNNEKEIRALFFEDKVQLALSDGRNFTLLHGISASGVRYVNDNESFVFWTKGDTAFIQEEDVTTYDNCLVKI